MAREDDEVLGGIDAPRRMPPSLRAWLEAELVAEAAAAHPPIDPADKTAALLAGIDGPRPLPAITRMRLTQTLLVASTASRRAAPLPRQRRHGWGAAAAIALAIVSSFAVMPERQPGLGMAVPEGVSESLALSDDQSDRLFSAFELGRPELPGVGRPGFVVDPPTSPELVSPLPAPVLPFAFSDQGGVPNVVEGGGVAPPFRISLVSGDVEAVAGFNAYVNTHNAAATGRTRPFEIVGPTQTADITVNLSGVPLAPRPGVVIETLLAPERLLHGNVFSFAGAVDRQAALIVDAVYPQPVNRETVAVVYREPSGVLYDDAAQALAIALAAKGVTPVMHVVEPGQPVAPAIADAVFLSLQPGAAKRVVAAYPATAHPRRGFNGLGTLAESEEVTGLPPGTRFISPYAFPASDEAAAIKAGTGHPAGARVYHGWIVAKTLAVAVWRDNPQNADELRTALQRMAHYANGFAPAYTYRPGTNSVQPEGVLFIVGQDGASQFGEFRKATG